MDDLEQEPPVTNRGVQNTSQHVLRACVDWVQVTFTKIHSVQQIYTILGLDESDFKDVSYSLYGYKSHKVCGNISILYDGRAGMGIHIQMTGQGCRQYETMGKKDWKEFIRTCFEYEGRFTRLDGAIDDLCYGSAEPYFRLPTLYRKIKDGCAVSRFKKGKRVESFSLDDGRGLGETLYFGREQSDIQFRIYEKDLERIANGEELEENLTCWIRTEMQCRRVRAEALALYILNNDSLGVVFAGVLKNYLDFKIKDPNESNRTRWKSSKFWLNFLGAVEPLQLTMIAPDKTIESMHRWVSKQVAPTLGTLFSASGGNLDLIIDLLNDGMDRMNENQKVLADQAHKLLEQLREQKEYEKKQEYQKYMFRSVNTNKKTHYHEDNEPDLSLRPGDTQ